MEAKELRIANYVENDIGDVIFIDSETLPFIVTKWIKCHHPIPLTEEWWVRFGAELKKVVGMDNEYNLKLGEVEISWDKKTGVTVFVLDTLESFRVSYIKYVHQFQNFCFALTNEELTKKQ